MHTPKSSHNSQATSCTSPKATSRQSRQSPSRQQTCEENKANDSDDSDDSDDDDECDEICGDSNGCNCQDSHATRGRGSDCQKPAAVECQETCICKNKKCRRMKKQCRKCFKKCGKACATQSKVKCCECFENRCSKCPTIQEMCQQKCPAQLQIAQSASCATSSSCAKPTCGQSSKNVCDDQQQKQLQRKRHGRQQPCTQQLCPQMPQEPCPQPQQQCPPQPCQQQQQQQYGQKQMYGQRQPSKAKSSRGQSYGGQQFGQPYGGQQQFGQQPCSDEFSQQPCGEQQPCDGQQQQFGQQFEQSYGGQQQFIGQQQFSGQQFGDQFCGQQQQCGNRQQVEQCDQEDTECDDSGEEFQFEHTCGGSDPYYESSRINFNYRSGGSPCLREMSRPCPDHLCRPCPEKCTCPNYGSIVCKPVVYGSVCDHYEDQDTECCVPDTMGERLQELNSLPFPNVREMAEEIDARACSYDDPCDTMLEQKAICRSNPKMECYRRECHQPRSRERRYRENDPCICDDRGRSTSKDAGFDPCQAPCQDPCEDEVKIQTCNPDPCKRQYVYDPCDTEENTCLNPADNRDYFYEVWGEQKRLSQRPCVKSITLECNYKNDKECQKEPPRKKRHSRQSPSTCEQSSYAMSPREMKRTDRSYSGPPCPQPCPLPCPMPLMRTSSPPEQYTCGVTKCSRCIIDSTSDFQKTVQKPKSKTSRHKSCKPRQQAVGEDNQHEVSEAFHHKKTCKICQKKQNESSVLPCKTPCKIQIKYDPCISEEGDCPTEVDNRDYFYEVWEEQKRLSKRPCLKIATLGGGSGRLGTKNREVKNKKKSREQTSINKEPHPNSKNYNRSLNTQSNVQADTPCCKDKSPAFNNLSPHIISSPDIIQHYESNQKQNDKTQQQRTQPSGQKDKRRTQPSYTEPETIRRKATKQKSPKNKKQRGTNFSQKEPSSPPPCKACEAIKKRKTSSPQFTPKVLKRQFVYDPCRVEEEDPCQTEIDNRDYFYEMWEEQKKHYSRPRPVIITTQCNIKPTSTAGMKEKHSKKKKSRMLSSPIPTEDTFPNKEDTYIHVSPDKTPRSTYMTDTNSSYKASSSTRSNQNSPQNRQLQIDETNYYNEDNFQTSSSRLPKRHRSKQMSSSPPLSQSSPRNQRSLAVDTAYYNEDYFQQPSSQVPKQYQNGCSEDAEEHPPKSQSPRYANAERKYKINKQGQPSRRKQSH